MSLSRVARATDDDDMPEEADQSPERFGIGHLFFLTSDAIVAADVATERIVLWNPAAERLFGYPAHDALGMRLDRLVPAALRDQHRAGLGRFRGGGPAKLVGGGPTVVPAVTRTGEQREVELSLTDISDGDERRHVVAVIRDVTEQRRAERDLAASHATLRQFLATVSHDLRAPLTSIQGFGQLLAQGDDLQDGQREMVAAIVRGAQRAGRLVNDLLTFAQLELGGLPTRPERVEVEAAVREALVRAGVEAAEVVVPEEAGEVFADADHVERILVNFLSNADRYGRPPIRVVAERGDDVLVRIRVCDDGDGVPADLEGRLFSSFAHGDDGGSVGLGLSIARGLAEANGGHAFHEAAGRGAVFGVALPAGG